MHMQHHRPCQPLLVINLAHAPNSTGPAKPQHNSTGLPVCRLLHTALLYAHSTHHTAGKDGTNNMHTLPNPAVCSSPSCVCNPPAQQLAEQRLCLCRAYQGLAHGLRLLVVRAA
jgi:hypothetical protein